MSTSVHLNPAAKDWKYIPPNVLSSHTSPNLNPAQTFHDSLPDFQPTPIYNLESLARELKIGFLLLKHESGRFGLPSFKVLGATWAIYRTVCEHIGLSNHSGFLSHRENHELPTLQNLCRYAGVDPQDYPNLKIITCTEGNWGRAVARMASLMGIPTTVYVPGYMHPTTRALIASEGSHGTASVDVIPAGNYYDDAVEVAQKQAEGDKDALLVMDISWEGYEAIPQWVVEGYRTMLTEADAAISYLLNGKHPTHAIIPCGCGSVAQAVTQHYKATPPSPSSGRTKVLAVETNTAACLRASLQTGKMTAVPTSETIMNGMNCGTLSTTAWPVLQKGVDACVVVNDVEAHEAIQVLAREGINAGPCGAATLAALKKVCEMQTERTSLCLNEDSVVVLYCTEGLREYTPPV
ncbi:tryptophan synthase beta subunit-like PLP-dependent enzyme [Podospora australis]|uniref:Tryptophan synthase beta subunit-like PLP-dependent enzyme n=1 Tax=Podospora australis TaxID=1536484 RepID=A0AAN7AP11_9PEZI|nr:tryptophan synthase beta subunit-like PLP-dependent enzyme [Podospora australis]